MDRLAVYLTGGVWIVLLSAYAIRVALRGAFRSARVESVGGTAIMGENIMSATYWGVEPIVRAFVAVGLSANGVTTLALILGIGAGVAIGFGAFGLACLLNTLSTIFDILDGQVARMTKTGSDVGELYDAAVDRYTEFALIAGFAFYARGSSWQLALALLALQSCFMISYASAKAEAMKVNVPRGIMRRHERAAILTLAAGVTPITAGVMVDWGVPASTPFAVGLALVGVLGTFAAVLRFVWISRALKKIG